MGVGRSAAMELIRLAYEGVLRRQAWGEMLALACQVFRCQDAYLVRAPVRPKGPRLLLTHGVDPKIAETYREVWITPPANPILAILRLKGFRGVIRPREVMPASAFERTEFFDVCRRPRRVDDELSCADVGGGGQIRFLSLNRARGDPPFGAREGTIMAFLFPHVIQALELDAVIAAERTRAASLGRALDDLDDPVLHRDPDGRLLPLNLAGESLLRASRLSHWTGGVPVARDPGTLLLRGGSTSRAGIAEGEPALICGHAFRVFSFPHFDGGRFSGEVLRLRRILGGQTPAAPLAAGTLTQHENRVLVLLCEGRSSADMCAILGIGLNTLNTHLRHLFQKTGCHSRSQLVARFGHLRQDQVAPSALVGAEGRSA